MRSLITKARILLVLVTVLSVMASCSKEIDLDDNNNTQQTGERTVNFTVRIPGITSPGTRVLGDNEENEINDLYVIAIDNSKKVKFVRKSTSATQPDSDWKQVFSVELSVGIYDLWIVANAERYMFGSGKPYLNTHAMVGKTETEVRNALKIALDGDYKWNIDHTDTNKGYLIPMWGYLKDQDINENNTKLGTAYMYRMTAKIEVELIRKSKGADVVTPSTFTMSEVRYCNFTTVGNMIPESANGNWLNGTAPIKPSMPSSPGQVTGHNSYQGFSTFANYTDTKENYESQALRGSIYSMEAEAGNSYTNRPCILIKGSYKGTPSWYRVDMINAANKYLPIMRNHNYRILIKKVTGPGYPDEETAYKSLPVNLETDIVEWHDGGVGDIYFDGQYYLRLDKGRYEFNSRAYDKEEPANKLAIETNYDDGWKFMGITYDTPSTPWLDFKGEKTGVADTPGYRWLEVQPNTTGKARTASIAIDAGRMKGTIQVTQLPQTELKLTLYNAANNDVEIPNGATLTFKSDPWEAIHACKYKLECSHPEAEIEVYLTNSIPGYDPIRFVNEDLVLDDGIITGKNIYTEEFQMQRFPRQTQGVFPKEGLEYMFIARYKGESVTRKFKVVHEYLDLQATELSGCTQGRFYDVTMDCNTKWDIEIIDNFGILDQQTRNNIPTTSQNILDPTQRSFKVRLNVDYNKNGRSATIRFKKPGTNDVFDEVNVTSYYNFPNSYIATQRTISFPITKAFWVRNLGLVDDPVTNINANAFQAKVIWEEDDPASSVSLNWNSSNPELSTITLNTGYDLGNVVVGLFYNNEIIWSWHIWVLVGQDPSANPISYIAEGVNFTLMRRNLGSRSTELGYNTTLGFYYQWGRKDPFPTSGSTTTPSNPALGYGNHPIKNRNGFSVGTSPAPTSKNLVNSIRNPHRFYTSYTEPYDWYIGSDTPYSTTLWRPDDGLKSEFDPCPDGWRVPNYHYVDVRYHYTFNFILSGKYEHYGWLGTPVGDLPNAGYINRQGNYAEVGKECWMWYGVFNNDRENNPLQGLGDRSWEEAPGYRRVRYGMPKATGIPIRCEKDNERYWPKWD